jgi:hypothetical protein
MKRLILYCTIIINTLNICHSQGVNNLWLMGYESWAGPPFGGSNIDFSNGVPDTSYINRSMDFYVTNAVICNSIGTLLFYSNGVYIANRNNLIMLNGDNLNPGPFTSSWADDGLPIPQGNIVIPIPGDSNKYYLFHETCTSIIGSNSKPLELFYTIIDMTLDSGFGAVISKNNIILQDTLEWGELSATKHGNGRDWWLLFHKVNSDNFYKILITPDSMIVSTQKYGTFRDLYGGASSFSPDGSKFAHYNSSTDLDIYDFDRCSGLLSNYINVSINDSALFGAVAFSPNSQVLYAASTNYVYQFDLLSTNIPSSIQTVAVWDSFYSPQPPLAANFCMPQIAPDNKIYVTCTNSTLDMHVINFPDSIGIGCDLQQHSIHLPSYNAFTIPNHPNYFLGSMPGSICDSLTPVHEISNNTIPIRINPNPAQNSFYLNYELPYGKTAIATIYNTIGEAIMHKNLYWYFGYLQIDCSDLCNGVYFVKVEAKGYGGSVKLVIAR